MTNAEKKKIAEVDAFMDLLQSYVLAECAVSREMSPGGAGPHASHTKEIKRIRDDKYFSLRMMLIGKVSK